MRAFVRLFVRSIEEKRESFIYTLVVLLLTHFTCYGEKARVDVHQSVIDTPGAEHT